MSSRKRSQNSNSVKFYRTEEFRKLHEEWTLKLEASEFVDIENKKEDLSQLDRRTQSFEQRDEILGFFLELDSFITTEEINPSHRQVLELFSLGTKVKGEQGIAVKTNYSHQGTYKIINQYKKRILGK